MAKKVSRPTKNSILTDFELFRGNGGGIESWFSENMPEIVVDVLANCERHNITLERLNQILIMSHEGGISKDFFKYYFLSDPHNLGHYWYDPKKLTEFDDRYLRAKSIVSLTHLKWGLKRLYIDGLLHFGNIRQCYRTLRTFNNRHLEGFFRARVFEPKELTSRGEFLPLEPIAKDDRYLIAEMACKTYAPADESTPDVLEYFADQFKRAKKSGKTRVKIKDLISPDDKDSRYDPTQLSFSLDEAIETEIQSESDLENTIKPLFVRFKRARDRALTNTRLYLSMIADLDVYVATSMRKREQFRAMADFCEGVFSDARIRNLKLRYFDPTLSAANNHEDKGLIECLMVKCAKILIYNAGDSDSYGKDAEAAMALSLGKPVIFYCDTETKRKIFREIHPLSRLINFNNGVAVGSIVIDNPREVPAMIKRIFCNDMEFELIKKSDNYFLLREKTTDSTIRLQSSDPLLRETFWNYYHSQIPNSEADN